MREKNYSNKTFSNNNVNYLKFPNKLQRYSRFLNNKKFDRSPSKNSKFRYAERSPPRLVDDHMNNLTNRKENVNNYIPEENKNTQELQTDDLENGVRTKLTKSSLKKLQKEVFDKELNNIACHHGLCSTKNRKDIKYSRLWFLFELEMSEDWKENLRLSCYNKYVYSAIDESWKMENILLKEQEKCYEYFPIQQLLIPAISESCNRRKSLENIQDLTVNVDSIIEINHEKQRLLPRSFLTRRENEVAFNDFQLDAKKILEDLSSTSENPFGSFNSSPSTNMVESEKKILNTVPKRRKEKKILGALEKKLYLDEK
ncbi:Mam1p [Saccharomyces eubayanus]|uniref:Mam1p n=1 Tax=Saccharomyces eubayanus TaxID=1080349 RepID=UPI0006C6E705|nr:MAM1-like protein [Saccharomyces eubayanus]KOH00057.1 MAM1-like protein [Saccharomyces eubayanus]